MNVFGQLSKNIESIDINGLFFEVLKDNVITDWIIDTIQDRLYNLGVDKMHNKLKTDAARIRSTHPYYSDTTVGIKIGAIDRPDGGGRGDSRTANVTLKDSGDFYDSMRVVVKRTLIQIEADFRKGSDHIQENFELSYTSPAKFEDFILGLTDEETNLLIDNFLLPRLRQLWINNALRNV